MDPMSEIWPTWQGRVISATLRLGRYLGGSDHSAVFLTEPAATAVKLVPAVPGFAESQLADWRTAAGLAHPHLIRLFETGRCELDGQGYLYAVMEYADQNLAQLLRHRPLTADETREVLPPTLEALGYLHRRNLVQGQLKPANILAVGDQLKLASDTVHGVREGGAPHDAVSLHDPPEAREGAYSAAGDIWGLGLTLYEALTRSRPSGLHEDRGAVVLPPDFSPPFREMVSRCLSRRPYDRPKVTEIEAWLRRHAAPAAPVTAREPAAPATAITPQPVSMQASNPPVARDSMTPETTKPDATRPDMTTPAPRVARPVAARTMGRDFAAFELSNWRSLAPLVLAAIVILALGWTGIRALLTHRGPAPPAARTLAQPQAPSPAAPAVPAQQPATAGQGQAALPAAVHEEIPDVPLRARRTIHGHIRVSVRVIVDKDGNVVAALVDHAGPSRYFARLAMAAARKWTFPPADAQSQRVELLRFEFGRDGTRGQAVAVR